MTTVKDSVKDFYKKASEEEWNRFYVYPNEKEQFDGGNCVDYESKDDCPSDSAEEYIDGDVLKYYDLCSELSTDKKDFLDSLGFELKTQCFLCRHADGGGTGVNACHIKYNGRYLTADELWLTDVKQRAIDLGYDVRDCSSEPECHIGWGFWGATSGDAWDALDDFIAETEVRYSTASGIKNFQGGYLAVINSFYAYGLYNITVPSSWKSVSEPYWDGDWVKIDYEMQNPDLTECPDYPTGYCYFYRGEPWISGEKTTDGGGQMMPPDSLGPIGVSFAGEPGDVVTLKLAKIDRRDLSIVTYPDELERTIPEPSTCEDYDNQTDCEAADCYWYNGSCHEGAPACSELDNQSDCERFGCYWWSDDTCHAEIKEEVTCDSNPYNSLGDTETGCKLLLHYDTEGDGKIGYNDWLACDTDHEDGVITAEEYNFVSDCYLMSTEEINALCPGCYMKREQGVCFSTGEDWTYPSMPGVFKGKIKLAYSCIKVSDVKTKPAPGTAGHVSSWSITENGTSITKLQADVEYDIEVHFASYPQIIHGREKIANLYGTLEFVSFTDANGALQDKWIPVLILTEEGKKKTVTFASVPDGATIDVID